MDRGRLGGLALRVHGADVPGRWVIVNQRFVAADDASTRNRSEPRVTSRRPRAMNEAFPQTDHHRAKCDHFAVAFTIARMPPRSFAPGG